MQSRRFVMGALLLVPFASQAQQASPFVGTWAGQVEGIGNARLIITAVKADGLAEGRMEFELQSYVTPLGAKVDGGANTSAAVVSGSGLRIETAMGGRYDLVLNGNRLTGTYARGTTMRTAASFTKVQN